MAATSAGLQSQQQQQQSSTDVVQHKTNTTLPNGGGAGLTRNVQIQSQPQIHNLQQQQHLMQQYAMKQQQQHANFLQQQSQQQQPNQTFGMQPTTLLQQPQQQQNYQIAQPQQQQQMLHNQFASNMMPCQNFMTPPPQLHSQPNRFITTSSSNSSGSSNNSSSSAVSNTISVSNTITWSQQYQQLQNTRKQPTIVVNHKTQQPQLQLQQQSLPKIVAPTKTMLPSTTLTTTSNFSNVQLNSVAASDNNTRQLPNSASADTLSKTNDHSNNNNNNKNVADLPNKTSKDSSFSYELTKSTKDSSHQLDVKPNLAPGWQRQSNNNNEIVYIR
ncbi:nuclear transcription factor Y subunit beta-like [Musca vetustissima]|uniref:nuclear transcription factor Y subunit beta-like n=1 Tax=Musca vetustissima TaxID=27455 RepID=UPI002AB7E1D7|nr:nuclear transcription factor Y subunit beta-like [Musca vetustissima]